MDYGQARNKFKLLKLDLLMNYDFHNYILIMIIPADYPLVLAAGLGITFHAFTRAQAVMAFRLKIFPKEFMEKEFGAIHQEQLDEPIQKGGYPDTGNGRYSQKLSYKDWYTFNVLQRVHLSYLEQLPFALAALVSAGIYRPRLASILGAIFIVGK
jgi:hypothetical protein